MSGAGDTVMAVLGRAVAQGQLPGAVAVIGGRGSDRAPVALGVRKYGGPPATTDTRYDLASLTKVVATLPAVVRLVSDGELCLDDTVGRFVTNAGWLQSPSLAEVTIRRLLAHTSGLPKWRPLFAWTSDRSTALAHAFQTPVSDGGALVYSDLGFIVLGAIVERVARQRLDEFVARNVFGPLGMTSTGYGPLSGVPVAATEDCGWRDMLLEGVVHDENAHRLDGVAGHAGLFGTAGDLQTYARAWLDLDRRLGKEAVLADMFRVHASDSRLRHGLGWRLKGVDSFAGDRATDQGFGHTGFTGTSLWIEPAEGWFAVMLSNRVHPSRRRGERIHQVRRAFHDAAAEEMRA